jgi:prepilin-type processing-associated H-X9-DG protein
VKLPKALGRLFIVFMWFFCSQAHADTCRDLIFEGKSYTACTVAATQDLRLFNAGPEGPYGSFKVLDDTLKAQGLSLGFAMNAGMFHRDLSPVGLYVELGQERMRLITSDGPGNFGLLPNGVLCILGASFAVIESLQVKAQKPDCRYATQSGPMLVIDGALHPKFKAGSDSRLIRNGVGTSADGQAAVFVISNEAVNFHEFARLFRDVLGTPNALFLDGSVSRLYDPEHGRHDGGFPMGPIVGTVVPYVPSGG